MFSQNNCYSQFLDAIKSKDSNKASEILNSVSQEYFIEKFAHTKVLMNAYDRQLLGVIDTLIKKNTEYGVDIKKLMTNIGYRHNKLLFEPTLYGDVATVKFILASTFKYMSNINEYYVDESPPLHTAFMMTQSKDMVIELFKYGAKNIKDIHGYLPLHHAARNGSSKNIDLDAIILILVDDPNSPNTPNHLGETPLQLAHCQHYNDLVNLMKDSLAIHQIFKPESIVSTSAAEKTNITSIKLLIESIKKMHSAHEDLVLEQSKNQILLLIKANCNSEDDNSQDIQSLFKEVAIKKDNYLQTLVKRAIDCIRLTSKQLDDLNLAFDNLDLGNDHLEQSNNNNNDSVDTGASIETESNSSKGLSTDDFELLNTTGNSQPINTD